MLKTASNASMFESAALDDVEAVAPSFDTTPVQNLDIACISDGEDFIALEHDWDALFSQSDTSHQVFQQFAWLSHWYAVFVEGAARDEAPRLAVVTGRINGNLVMVWPLVERRSAGVRTIEWMGSPVSQYGDMIVAPHKDQKDWFDAGLKFINTALKPDALVLSKVREDSQFARLHGASKVLRLARQQAPYVDLSSFDTFADFQAAYSKRTRKTRSRKRRRFMEKPDARAEIVSESVRAGEITSATLEIKRQWLEGRNVVSRAFSTTQFDAFMRRAVTAQHRPVHALASAFSFDGQIVAGEIGFKNNDTYFSHVAAYDLDHARLSAGVLQFEDTIEHCIENNIRTIDMLAPADPYKVEWATGSVNVDDLALPLTVKGYVAVVLRSGWARAFMRRCANLLPKPVRTHLARHIGKAL